MKAKEAKKILPKSEFEAFENILVHQMGKIPRARLMQKATLARKLRDKYRHHSRREVIEAKSRLTNSMDTDINDRRVRLLQDIIDTLENKLDEPRHQSSNAPAKKKKSRSVKSDSHFRIQREEKKALLEARRRSR